MAFAYHGNYCGPGWSAGKYQNSVESNVLPIDDFDTSCQQHDAAYARGDNRFLADLQFLRDNATITNPKRLFAAGLVGIQGIARGLGILSQDGSVQPKVVEGEQQTQEIVTMTNKRNFNTTNQPNKQLRSNLATSVRDPLVSIGSNAIAPRGVTATRAPSSIGNTVQSVLPERQYTRQGCRIVGREFASNVYETSNSNWQLGSLTPLNPCYFPSSVIGTTARVYAKFRFKRLVFHFITRQPTSATGEVALVYSSNPVLPAENGASGTFLAKVMSRGNAIIGPIWGNHSINIPCDQQWRFVDCLSSSTVMDNIMGEVQVYTLSSTTDTAGYLLMDYELEFSETVYTPHGTYIPVSTGTGQSLTLTDSSATPTALNAVQVTNSTVTGIANGSIWRFVMNADESTPATGTTLANAWQFTNALWSNTTTQSSNANNFTIVDGQAFYGVVINTSCYLYMTLEGATSGDGTGQVFYRTTGSTAGVFLVNGYMIRMSSLYISSLS